MKYLVALVLLFTTVSGFASPINVTIPDGYSSTNYGNGAGASWYGTQEDQEVEPGCYTGQMWDLEGFYVNGTQLQMVGGFSFTGGTAQDWGGSIHTVPSGDIFIGKGTDGRYGAAAGTQNQPANANVHDNFGYDYVIHMDWNDLTFQVMNISTGDVVLHTVNESTNANADPLAYVSGGTPVAVTDNSITYAANLSDALAHADGYLDENGNALSSAADPNHPYASDYTPGHNVASFDIGWLASLLPDGQSFTAHFTYDCGNDYLVGQGLKSGDTITGDNPLGDISPVAEPSTIVLLALGLGALAVGRKIGRPFSG